MADDQGSWKIKNRERVSFHTIEGVGPVLALPDPWWAADMATAAVAPADPTATAVRVGALLAAVTPARDLVHAANPSAATLVAHERARVVAASARICERTVLHAVERVAVHNGRVDRHLHLPARDRSACRKTPFPSTLPVFVPSLSWQIDRV